MAPPNTQENSYISNSQRTYHIFLSFRGKDARKTFVDLYSALVHAGFRVFIDENDFESGESIKLEIDKAIEQSSCSMIVLSKNYTSSTWCLNELVKILECKRIRGHVVLPIFYDLEPCEVRKQIGHVRKSFEKHEERFKEEADHHEGTGKWIDKLKIWREALREVADLSGIHLQNQANGYESKCIEKIVQVIEDKLACANLFITPFPIGVHSRVKNINLWLNNEFSDVGVLVICGMGGLGKTTVAKYIYNQHCQRFEGCSFLANIRETSEQDNGLVSLQKQLIVDILKKKKEKIHNVDEGIIKIRDVIYPKRILLVLDDVDKEDHLNAIFGMHDFLHKGSKVIVTTRNEGLLKAYGHGVYKLQKFEVLGNHEALELFSWHAFGQNYPVEGYKKISEELVAHCGELPLALVLGSSLSGKKIDLWRSSVEKLEAIPNSQIVSKLKISYDCLQDDHDKNLFLDIACFFIGKCKDYVITVLDACNFYTTIKIQNLLDRSLLTIDENNKLKMHQLVRDMGREIVRQESSKEPGMRSRLWHHKDSFDVLREKSGTGIIEGLILDVHALTKGKSAPNISSISGAKKRGYDEFVDHNNIEKRRRLGFFSWNLVHTFSRK